ncbi:hypothetical protein DID80_02145 [Candidatus Marinamargulisbacteria bacterium SCGC AAA071-K20]|nr:hypothetical protein DID80_02145 [Candidatus Marinamargulisbacteria bacterium SCGC AAA071-K20]
MKSVENKQNKSSKFISFLEWIFGLNSSEKKEKNYGSWIITILIVVFCSLLAVYNQIYHYRHVSFESWKVLKASTSSYEHVLDQLNKADINTTSSKASISKSLETISNTQKLPDNTFNFEAIDKNATTITTFFELHPPKTPTMKRLHVRFESSRDRLILSYSQFFEHSSVYNAYLEKFPHRYYQNYFNVLPIELYTLKNTYDIKLVSTRH